MQYIQYKYTFFHKVVCRLIVLTCSYLMVCVRTVEDARCETKTGCINATEMVYTVRSIAITQEATRRA